MIVIDDILVSDDIVEAQFVCNLSKCKGGCCEDGDAGAPLENKEKDFIKELKSHGHKIQVEFRGYQVGKVSGRAEQIIRKSSKTRTKSAWKIEGGLLRFWDGSDYLEGEDPGLYELLGENHYWDGVEWWIPDEAGIYEVNGEDKHWNGKSWD